MPRADERRGQRRGGRGSRVAHSVSFAHRPRPRVFFCSSAKWKDDTGLIGFMGVFHVAEAEGPAERVLGCGRSVAHGLCS